MEIAQTDSVFDFLHDSLSANSYQNLVMSIFQSTDDLELGIGIQIPHKNNILNYALDESQKESNTALINTHKDLVATCARAKMSTSHRDLIKLIVHDVKSELNLILTP